MSEIRNLTRNGETFYPLTIAEAVSDPNAIFGKYIDNPEWIRVILDSEDKILCGIKYNGEIEWSSGVPTPVKEYIQQKIEELSLDEYEDIVNFLNGLEKGDNTLQELLNLKANKANSELTGKISLDKEVGENDKVIEASIQNMDNPEFVKVEVDSDGKILEATKIDGTKVISGDTQIGGSTTISGDATILGKVDIQGVTYTLMQNEEWIRVIIDAQDHIFCGIKADGSIYLNSLTEIPSIIQDVINAVSVETASLEERISAIESVFSIIDNQEYIAIETDNDGRMLSGRNLDGSKFENLPTEFKDKVSIDGNVIENTQDLEGRTEVKTDSEGKIISYRDKEGTLHENVGIEAPSINTNRLNLTEHGMSDFQQALIDSGFTIIGKTDWSDYISEKGKKPLQLPIPDCAIINVSNETGNAVWPTTKTDNYVYYMEYWDKLGNYFKKNIVMDAQGRSSLQFAKKNASFKIFDKSVYNSKGKLGKGDKFGVRFGNWPVQTGFHAKAYYTDFFRGINVLCYTMMNNIWKSRGIYKDRPYKKELLPSAESIGYSHDTAQVEIKNTYLQIDNGARCIPDGFPVIMYLNGVFYGVYSWQIKKDQANYYMDKETAENIHLDGNINNAKLFGANGNVANIDFDPSPWGGFEIRNPEDIWTSDGNSYDADVEQRQAPVDSETAEGWISDVTTIPSGSDLEDEVIEDPDNPGSYILPEDIITQLRYSAEVLDYIKTLSTYIPTLQSMRNGGSTDVEIKAKIEEFFDVETIIDYILFSSISDNWDGFSANWQWTTWDGIKWALCPYDMDNVFGAMEQGNVLRNYTANKFCNTNRELPSGWITTYYQTELKARWQELVDKKIVTPDAFQSILMNWIERIGVDNYDKEFKKWPTTPCNRKSNQNADYWNYTGNVQSSGWNPPAGTAIWDANSSYAIDDEVWFKAGRWYQFKAVQASVGQQPIKDADLYTDGSPALGFRDSIYRVINTYNHHYNTFNEYISNLNV